MKGGLGQAENGKKTSCERKKGKPGRGRSHKRVDLLQKGSRARRYKKKKTWAVPRIVGPKGGRGTHREVPEVIVGAGRMKTSQKTKAKREKETKKS